MRAFEPYAITLEQLARASVQTGPQLQKEEIAEALNGGPGRALRRFVPLEQRRKKGAFFTSPDLANQALGGFLNGPTNQVTFLDPACGAGDLLISCSRFLPVADCLEATLALWGKCLIGYDLQAEFVRASKARLVLAAIARGVRARNLELDLNQLFPLLSVRNALKNLGRLNSVTHIVLNPSFYMTNAPQECCWAMGKVSTAAVFLENCLCKAVPGTKILAILPDVLRTGERYEKWRERISSLASIDKLVVFGQFDPWTDIDVFFCHLTAGNSAGPRPQWWNIGYESGPSISVGDLFNVHVGAVVPHRDPETGKTHPYIHSRRLPRWETIRTISEHRRFSGTLFSPPFVAVRRTSRPGDISRAIGTILEGSQPIAVENHLLVLQPKDGSLKTCRKLLAVLRMSEASQWLDQRIRCRHLTVSSLRELPWWSKDK